MDITYLESHKSALRKFTAKIQEYIPQKKYLSFSVIGLLAIIALTLPIWLTTRQVFTSHASLSVYSNCIQPPKGLDVAQLQKLATVEKVNWCTNIAAVNTFKTIAALGDSITAGFRDCQSLSNCPLEPNTYLYLYAASVLPSGSAYSNFGYAGTTAACSELCATTDTADTSSTAFKNSYLNNTEVLPNNESSIQTTANMEARTAPGIVRANLGEFDNVCNAQVILAWGRNDIDTPAISLSAYRNAILTIANRIEKNASNSIIFLTISPLDKTGWSIYAPQSTRRTEFNDRIADTSYPRELDAFFSSQEWEVAYATHAQVAPLAEYLWHSPSSTYLSSDHIHPSSQGYQLIASVLKNETGYVSKTPVSLPVGSKYVISAHGPTYGEIVSQKNGQFYYAEPFYADQNTPYVSKVLTPDSVIYSNNLISLEQNVSINTEVGDFKIHGMDVDSMTAYGKGWNWNMNGLPWVGNGFDLTTVDRFISGPCKGKSMGQCNFETRSEFLINGAEVESIYAYGKYWNFYAENGTPWPSTAASSNGNDLTSVARYANGPCKDKAPGTCIFTSRQQVFLSNRHWKEEVVAYDEKWDWDENGNLVSHTPVTSLPVAVVSSPVNLSVDLNHDGKVDAADYQYFRNCYGLADSQPTAACSHPSWADLNSDGVVNGIDYNLFLRAYAQGH